MKYKLEENVACQLCRDKEYKTHKNETNHIEKQGMNGNNNKNDRKTEMKTGKLRKGKYEVKDLLHERIKKRKKNERKHNIND